MKSLYKKNKSSTILIIDSGVGGLSVYTAIKKKLPYAHYLYFLDNQSFPYGEKSSELIINRIILIIKTIRNLYKLDLVIIACNTASIAALKILKNIFIFPIIGVLPAIQLASKFTKNRTIGILATNFTTQYLYTTNLIKYLMPKYKITLLGTSELVKIAESKIYGETIQKPRLYKIFKSWLAKQKSLPDTIVLGCTHFSLLKKELLTIFPNNSYLIDSTYTTVQSSINLLKNKTNIYNNYNINISHQNKAYCSLNTKHTKKLQSILILHYNFHSLETLSI